MLDFPIEVPSYDLLFIEMRWEHAGQLFMMPCCHCYQTILSVSLVHVATGRGAPRAANMFRFTAILVNTYISSSSVVTIWSCVVGRGALRAANMERHCLPLVVTSYYCCVLFSSSVVTFCCFAAGRGASRTAGMIIVTVIVKLNEFHKLLSSPVAFL